jgi:hypothetical protein
MRFRFLVLCLPLAGTLIVGTTTIASPNRHKKGFNEIQIGVPNVLGHVDHMHNDERRTHQHHQQGI